MAQVLETLIRINAEMGNGFSKVGATLSALGSIVDGLSSRIIQFGEESVEVFRDYEQSMKDAEVALSTSYGRSTAELQKVMDRLGDSATEWAANTIFHTDDVANAISEAAHAGWDYEKIMSGIPAAMELAQAGSIDLSDAVNYIVKAVNAAGIGFEDTGEFIDQWTYAANSSASTIERFGDTMLRMGSTMRFAADQEELLTLIAETANAGATGEEAGTMIRNSMMRLVAPTEKAQKAMAELGAASDETAALLTDEALVTANATLAAQGFSAFDEHGDLKNILDIYRELYVALGEVAGGYDNITRNEDALQVLGAIFPTRTITEALNLLHAAEEGYGGLYEELKAGAAEGYGEYAAETMMDSLYGATELYESKIERLKQVVGEELSGELEGVMGFAGELVDSIAELDPESMDMLIRLGGTLAAAGPALLTAGAAFRLIGLALNPAGISAAVIIALTGLVSELNALERQGFSENFGNMTFDTEAVEEYVWTLGSGFRAAYAEADRFRAACDAAAESYEKASSTLGSELLTALVTNAALTAEDKDRLMDLADDMQDALIEGIENDAASQRAFWDALFGAGATAENEAYVGIVEAVQAGYRDARAEAEGIGEELRGALTDAFSDGEISDEEYQNILSYMNSYNDAMARAAAESAERERQIEYQMMLHKAQTASFSDLAEMGDAFAAARDEELAELEQNYEYNRAKAAVSGADEAALSAADAAYAQAVAEANARYAEGVYTLWDSQLRQSGQAENLEQLGAIAAAWQAGLIGTGTALDIVQEAFGGSLYSGTGWSRTNDRAQLGKMLGYVIDDLGGEAGVEALIGEYSRLGNADMAAALSNLYAMEQLALGFVDVTQTGNPAWDRNGLITGDFVTAAMGDSHERAMTMAGERAETEAFFSGGTGTVSTLEGARQFVETLGGQEALFSGAIESTAKWNEFVDNLSAAYDLSNQDLLSAGNEGRSYTGDLRKLYNGKIFAREDYLQHGIWNLLYGDASTHAEDYRISVIPEIDESAMATDFDPVPLPIEPYVEGTDAIESLQSQGVEVNVGADTEELTATIDAEDGQTLLEYVDGDTDALSMKITDQNGKTLQEWVTGDATSLANTIASYEGRTVTVYLKGQKLFAEGGRATTASIFGEAGPEWAIPEEHSERTAALLNAARAASGFSWPELLARFGGLNADPSNRTSTVVYSPVIHAADAAGVDDVLREDKRRLERWWEERARREAVEVYA